MVRDSQGLPDKNSPRWHRFTGHFARCTQEIQGSRPEIRTPLHDPLSTVGFQDPNREHTSETSVAKFTKGLDTARERPAEMAWQSKHCG